MIAIIVGIAVVVAATVLCIVLIKAAYKIRQNKIDECTEPVQGICNHIEVVTDKRGCYIYVHFDYSYNGQNFTNARNYNEKIVSWLKKKQALAEIKYEEGREYTIYVNPDKPSRFRILV